MTKGEGHLLVHKINDMRPKDNTAPHGDAGIAHQKLATAD
jgi:hypothetical protein